MASTQASIKDHVHITETVLDGDYCLTGKVAHTVRKMLSRKSTRDRDLTFDQIKAEKAQMKIQVIRDCWHPFHNETYRQIHALQAEVRRSVRPESQAVLLELCQDMLKTLDRPE